MVAKKPDEEKERDARGQFLPVHATGGQPIAKLFSDKRTNAHKFVETKLQMLISDGGGPKEIQPAQWDILDRIRKYLQDLYLYNEWIMKLPFLVNPYGQIPKVQDEYRRTEQRYGQLVAQFRSLIVDEKSEYDKMMEAMEGEDD
jgi:hypothetical protein